MNRTQDLRHAIPSTLPQSYAFSIPNPHGSKIFYKSKEKSGKVYQNYIVFNSANPPVEIYLLKETLRRQVQAIICEFEVSQRHMMKICLKTELFFQNNKNNEKVAHSCKQKGELEMIFDIRFLLLLI